MARPRKMRHSAKLRSARTPPTAAPLQGDAARGAATNAVRGNVPQGEVGAKWVVHHRVRRGRGQWRHLPSPHSLPTSVPIHARPYAHNHAHHAPRADPRLHGARDLVEVAVHGHALLRRVRDGDADVADDHHEGVLEELHGAVVSGRVGELRGCAAAVRRGRGVLPHAVVAGPRRESRNTRRQRHASTHAVEEAASGGDVRALHSRCRTG